MNTANKVAFVEWIKYNEPVLYNVAVKAHALKNGVQAIHGLADYQPMGAIDFGAMFNTVVDVVGKVVPSVVALRSQKDILNAQLERAKQGLPPMEVKDYMPVINVSPKVDKEAEDALVRVATQTTDNTLQKYGIYIAGGVIALMFLMRKKGRR